MSGPTLFCLEGDWDEGLTSKRSVRPLLELIEAMGFSDGTIHRDAARRDEFNHYFEQWLALQPARYPIAYLASHGSAAGLSLGYEVDSAGNQSHHQRSLASLSRLMQGKPTRGRVLYFGACEVLDREPRHLQGFCRETKVDAIIGYSRAADWLESAACDLLVLSRLLEFHSTRDGFSPRALQRLFNGVTKDLPRFVDEYGFTIATPTWHSSEAVE